MKIKNIQKSIMLRGNLAIQNPNYVKKLQLKQIFCCETRVRGK